ncbi:MAG: hypothetical protein ABL907_00560 [Hyphomicrobium sp.]
MSYSPRAPNRYSGKKQNNTVEQAIYGRAFIPKPLEKVPRFIGILIPPSPRGSLEIAPACRMWIFLRSNSVSAAFRYSCGDIDKYSPTLFFPIDCPIEDWLTFRWLT